MKKIKYFILGIIFSFSLASFSNISRDLESFVKEIIEDCNIINNRISC